MEVLLKDSEGRLKEVISDATNIVTVVDFKIEDCRARFPATTALEDLASRS